MKVFLPEPIHVSFLNEYDCVLEFPADFELHKMEVDLQQITQWFGYHVVITCEVLANDKLNDTEKGREECNLPPPPSLHIMVENFKNPTVSVQEIEQQVEKATQGITNWLVNHVNQQVSCLEAIVSKCTNLNDDGQHENRYNRYQPIEVAQDDSGFLDK